MTPLLLRPAVLHPENVRRDLRHVSGRIARVTNHRVLDHLRPAVRGLAAAARKALHRPRLPGSGEGNRATVWNSSNLLTLTGLALGSLVLVAATASRRRE